MIPIAPSFENLVSHTRYSLSAAAGRDISPAMSGFGLIPAFRLPSGKVAYVPFADIPLNVGWPLKCDSVPTVDDDLLTRNV